MSTQDRQGILVAQWRCLLCDLLTQPIAGLYADAEAAQLATVHDQVHHRGARTARSVVVDVIAFDELLDAVGADGVEQAVAAAAGDTVVTVTENVLNVPAGAWGPQAAAS